MRADIMKFVVKRQQMLNCVSRPKPTQPNIVTNKSLIRKNFLQRERQFKKKTTRKNK